MQCLTYKKIWATFDFSLDLQRCAKNLDCQRSFEEQQSGSLALYFFKKGYMSLGVNTGRGKYEELDAVKRQL